MNRVIFSSAHDNWSTPKAVYRALDAEFKFNVDIDKSEIFTDEYKVYNKVNNLAPHSTVNHGMREYVSGDVHTNSIESFWALVKRAYYGQYHHYSKKHTSSYIGEAVFKYNHRNEKPLEVFDRILEGVLYV